MVKSLLGIQPFLHSCLPSYLSIYTFLILYIQDGVLVSWRQLPGAVIKAYFLCCNVLDTFRNIFVLVTVCVWDTEHVITQALDVSVAGINMRVHRV